MSEENRIALEDCFMDTPNTDARKFIFDTLKMACHDAKKSLRNKTTLVNQRNEFGQIQQQEISLKDIDLSKYELDSNPKWLPKGLEPSDSKPIELKLGDNTMQYLKAFGQIILIRHEKFNQAEEDFYKTAKARLIAAKTPDTQMEMWEKQQVTMREQRKLEIPNCLEAALFASIWGIIQQKIDQSDMAIFDKEFSEQYKPENEDT